MTGSRYRHHVPATVRAGPQCLWQARDLCASDVRTSTGYAYGSLRKVYCDRVYVLCAEWFGDRVRISSPQRHPPPPRPNESRVPPPPPGGFPSSGDEVYIIMIIVQVDRMSVFWYLYSRVIFCENGVGLYYVLLVLCSLLELWGDCDADCNSDGGWAKSVPCFTKSYN